MEEVIERTGYDLDDIGGPLPTLALAEGYLNQETDRAEFLLRMECEAEKGDPTAAQSMLTPVVLHYPTRDSRTTEAIFTEEVARTHGYSHPDPPELARVNAMPSSSLPQNESRECGDKALAELDAPTEALEYIDSVRWAGRNATSQDGEYVTQELKIRSEEWRRCMDPLGVPDLPSLALDMPPASVVPDGAPPTRTPSRREIEVATADFKCRVSSGLWESEWRSHARAELAAIGRSWERYQSAVEEIDAYFERVRGVTARLGS